MWTLWREALKNWRFTASLIITLAVLIAFGNFLPHFFMDILLSKTGVAINDPILNSFTPHNWSIEIFVLIYSCVAFSIVSNFAKPHLFLLGLETYAAVNIVRLASLYLVTLEAPEGIIPLADPLLSVLAYGQPTYLKDLFFSGHISTLCLLLFIEQKKVLKYFILTCTIAVAVFLAWQRVHYTLDMIAAPVVTWLVLNSFKRINAHLILQ